jgi:hypothetical protein
MGRPGLPERSAPSRERPATLQAFVLSGHGHDGSCTWVTISVGSPLYGTSLINVPSRSNKIVEMFLTEK